MLSLVAYIPFIGALLILIFVSKENRVQAKIFATIFAAVDLLLSLVLLKNFDLSNESFQMVEHFNWIPTLGISYHLGIDGLSLVMIILTTVLGLIAIISSYTAIVKREKEYYAFLLLLQTGMLGTFMAMDVFLFYLFWEFMLIPMFFLIGIWGGERRIYATVKFFLFTFFGSIFMLVAILALYYLNYRATGQLSFALEDFYKLDIPFKNVFGLDIQCWIFLGLFMGFAIKVPMFPFHTWLPDAHTEAPTAGSVILAGVLLKFGAYGFIRFAIPIVPVAVLYFMPFMCILAIIGIIYGALVCLMQQDMKRLIAYSSVSHMGFVMLGIFAFNLQALEGGILQMINHGLSTGGLFLCVGLIYERRHTRMINEYGGVADPMPVFATLFMIICLSSVGLPGLNGFIGEFLILLGTFAHNKFYAFFAASGVVLGAAYLLWLYQRVMFGPVNNEKNKALKDLNHREIWILMPIILLCFWIGMYPKPVMKYIEPVSNQLIQVLKEAKPDLNKIKNIEESSESSHIVKKPHTISPHPKSH